MRRFGILIVIISIAILTIAACGSNPLQPTATAVPLAATATPRPLPTLPAPAATAPETPTATAQPITPTPAATALALPSELDDMLAERTVQGFLDRLTRGETASALSLFLTDAAQEREAARQLSEPPEAGSTLVAASLLDLERATASSYEARALLRWQSPAGGTATQALTTRLIYQRGLWLIDDLSLGDRQALLPTPTPQGHSSSGQRRPAPRLAGKLVFQTSSGGDIYVINADGTGRRRLTDGLDPAWSPDGSQVALSRWREPRGVWIVQADGSGERRLFAWSESRTPAWSPDGSQIAFVRQHGGRLDEVEKCFWHWCFTLPPDLHWTLGVLRVDDGSLSEPPASNASLAPTWSPKGDRLVYHGQQGLMWTDLTDASTGRFETSSGWDTSPAYSPDGATIAFVGRVHTHWEIFVMNADGSGRQQLTSSGSLDQEARHSVSPAWSPDGKQIAFLSNRGGPWRIYVMSADGSQQRPMFGAKLDDLGLRYGFAGERVLSWSR